MILSILCMFCIDIKIDCSTPWIRKNIWNERANWLCSIVRYGIRIMPFTSVNQFDYIYSRVNIFIHRSSTKTLMPSWIQYMKTQQNFEKEHLFCENGKKCINIKNNIPVEKWSLYSVNWWGPVNEETKDWTEYR